MRLPILVREIRVWWYCPEIRSHVSAGIMWYLARLMLGVPLAAVGLPVFLAAMALKAFGETLETTAWVIARPSAWAGDKRQSCIRSSHDILPIDEIRRRTGRQPND